MMLYTWSVSLYFRQPQDFLPPLRASRGHPGWLVVFSPHFFLFLSFELSSYNVHPANSSAEDGEVARLDHDVAAVHRDALRVFGVRDGIRRGGQGYGYSHIFEFSNSATQQNTGGGFLRGQS